MAGHERHTYRIRRYSWALGVAPCVALYVALCVAACGGSGSREVASGAGLQAGRDSRTGSAAGREDDEDRETKASNNGAPGEHRGGTIQASVRSEPPSFNVDARRDATTYLVSLLTHARLVRVNAATQQIEPWLAERFARDGLTYRLWLRPDLTFADGVPVTADDVLFSLAAAYDEASVIADGVMANGHRLKAVAVDAHTVDIVFPEPYGPGLRLLDNLPILPKHKLQAALDAGAFGRAWSVTTPPSDITGLGPFVLDQYVPGQRMVFVRNPHYFRKDANGVQLPYLDRLIVQIVPDQEGEILRLQTGEVDMTASEVRSDDYAGLRRAADAGRLQLLDLGVAQDPDAFWMNLTPGAFAADARRGWIQRDELRQAISLSVDRQAFADAVFRGAAVPVYGPVTPANTIWYSDQVPHTRFDPAAARRDLASIGLSDPDGDGVLGDAQGHPARFTLLTAKGQTALERGAAVIRDDLAKVGLVVDVVTLEPNALVQRFLSGRGYDAVYFHLTTTDTDPAGQGDFWRSDGAAHAWNLASASKGGAPHALDWERAIDRLMAQQAASFDLAERQRLFVEVQQIFAAHLPMIHFAAPRVFVAASSRVTNLLPALSRPQLLWSADTLALAAGR